jgi:hypothetical protein
MDRKIFLKWLRINVMFFMGAFIIGLLLSFLFPDIMLGFIRKWGAYTISVGPTIIGQSSSEALFVNILAKNGIMTILYFIASLFFLAPLLAIIGGSFYSLGLMSALERGLVPFWHSPILIAIEISFILLTITFASALGSEIFGANPSRKDISNFWKKNWKRLSPKQKRNWKEVFKENKTDLILFAILVSILILIGAWFEILF